MKKFFVKICFVLSLTLFVSLITSTSGICISEDLKSNLDAAIEAVNSGKRGEELWILRFFEHSGFDGLVTTLHSQKDRDLEFFVSHMKRDPDEFMFKYRKQFFELLNTVSEFLPPIDKQDPKKSMGYNYLGKKYGYSVGAVSGVRRAMDWKYKLDEVYEQANSFAKDGINGHRARVLYNFIAGYRDSEAKLKGLDESASGSYFTITFKNAKEIKMVYSGNFVGIIGGEEIQVWDLKNKKKAGTLKSPEFFPRVTMPSISSNGRFVLFSKYKAGTFLADIVTDKISQIAEKAIAAVFSPRLGFIGIAYDSGSENSFEIIRTKDSKIVLNMPMTAGHTGAILFSEDDKKVFIGISNFVIGYDTDTMEQICKIKMKKTVERRYSSISAISSNANYLVLDTNWIMLVDIGEKNSFLADLPSIDSLKFMGNDLIVDTDDKICLMDISKNKCIRSVDLAAGRLSAFNYNKKMIVLDDKILLMSIEEELGDTVLTFNEVKF
ncbi:hypothetical protein QUF72_11755 [Desulfobacterales bacterium HSG2]|nr:hypothetical protein [Desulfobacterales bacterium HSG2]